MKEVSSSEKILFQLSKVPTLIPCSKLWASSLKYEDKSSLFVSPSPFQLRLSVELPPITLDEGVGIDTEAGSLYTWARMVALCTASPPKSSSVAIPSSGGFCPTHFEGNTLCLRSTSISESR